MIDTVGLGAAQLITASRASVNRRCPTGTYKVSVVATTVLNQHLSGSRTYKSCTLCSGTIGLKRVKKHHHHG